MSNKKRVLTGITTSGIPHIGNLAGAILPAIKASQNKSTESFLFLADYHSLIKNNDPELTHTSSYEIAACWLACGLDPEEVIFYRQSDIPHIMELSWVLGCLTSKGLMNRAHAYKAAVAENKEEDPDKGITMGLFNYPVLMAADILMFNADVVPVGEDQKQHLEMTRDMINKMQSEFNDFDPEMKIIVNMFDSRMTSSIELFSDIINPAAAFRHTALEKSLSLPSNISIILFALNFASSPIRFSNLSAFTLNSFGSMIISDITLFFN